MASYDGTSGPDVVNVGPGDFFNGLAGDDRITLLGGWSATNPGPGNDHIVVAGERPWESSVMYWERGPVYPSPVTVDLEAGYAIDGWGDRDTLVNVRDVHGAHQPGDRFLGSRFNDNFWMGTGFSQTPARVLIDGRGGDDMVNFGASPESGMPVISVSADARVVRVHHENFPQHVFELRNVERYNTVQALDSDIWVQGRFADLIDPAAVGAQVLLVSGTGKGWQTGAPGSTVGLSYSFMNAAPSYGGHEGGTGFTAFSPAQQQVVREILARLSQQVGLDFTEVAAGQGQLQFGINQQTSTRGYSFSPSEVGDARAGDVWLDVETAALLAPGQEGRYVLLHEIGHALGLAHPLPESDTSGATVLLDRWYDLRHTIMLQEAPVQILWPSWFAGFDLDALRYLYGQRTVAGGDDVYLLTDTAGRQAMALLDDGGTDTISAWGMGFSVHIDLRPGRTSSVGLAADGRAATDNLTLGADTWIENAVGTVHDDVLVGNALNNRLRGGGGNDLIDGQGGLDWAVFDAPMAQYTVASMALGGYWTVVAIDGEGGYTELRNIERIVFGDQRGLALDTTADGAAGQAALLIGAVLGGALMRDKPELMGAVIGLFDQGFSLPVLAGALMRLKLDAAGTTGLFDLLAGSSSAPVVAGYLHRTVHGVEPTPAELAAAVEALTQQPEGAYLAGLATSAANQQQVGLTGLIDTGLEVVFPPDV